MKSLTVGIIPALIDGIPTIPERYIRSVEQFGGNVIEIPRESSFVEMEAIADRIDGLYLSGGVDVNPSRFGQEIIPQCGKIDDIRDIAELQMIPIAMRKGLPILGICRGVQILNVAFGGTLVQDIPTRFGTNHQIEKMTQDAYLHDVRIEKESMLYELTGDTLTVNSYHHQCIDILAPMLKAVAYAQEGFIEAVEMPCAPNFVLGLQWHPEVTRCNDAVSAKIFDLYGEAVRKYAESKTK